MDKSNRKQESIEKYSSAKNKPKIIISLFLSSQQSIEIPVYEESQIDDLVDHCIRQNKLSYKAKQFIERQIQKKLKFFDNLSIEEKQKLIKLTESNFGKKVKKDSLINTKILKKNKFQTILSSIKANNNENKGRKIKIQKIPHNIPIIQQQKFKKKSKESNPKPKNLKRTYSQSQQTEIDSIVNSLKILESSQYQAPIQAIPKTPSFCSNRLKTQGDFIYKEYCLADLQKQMQKQIQTLKIIKQIKNIEPQLYQFFTDNLEQVNNGKIHGNEKVRSLFSQKKKNIGTFEDFKNFIINQRAFDFLASFK